MYIRISVIFNRKIDQFTLGFLPPLNGYRNKLILHMLRSYVQYHLKTKKLL